ncbi:MAG: hypothetical protein ACLFV6_17410 [Spirulinaceae cyanobacterium]
MAQVSFWRKQLLLLLTAKPAKFDRRHGLRPKRWSRGGLWCLLGLILLGFWNWQLFLATVTGIAIMTGVYGLQNTNWPKYRSQLQNWLKSPHRPFTIAVSSGGFAAFLTYLAATLWSHSENRWLATGAILQGFATLLTLGLLGWQICARQSHNDENLYNLYLSDLADPDSLKRLIAIRQLTRLAAKHRVNPSLRSQIKEYFSVMLTQESNAIARDALLDSLHHLGGTPQDDSNPKPLQMPLHFKKSPSQIQA